MPIPCPFCQSTDNRFRKSYKRYRKNMPPHMVQQRQCNECLRVFVIPTGEKIPTFWGILKIWING